MTTDESAIANWEIAFEALQKRRGFLEEARKSKNLILIKHCEEELAKAEAAYDRASTDLN